MWLLNLSNLVPNKICSCLILKIYYNSGGLYGLSCQPWQMSFISDFGFFCYIHNILDFPSKVGIFNYSDWMVRNECFLKLSLFLSACVCVLNLTLRMTNLLHVKMEKNHKICYKFSLSMILPNVFINFFFSFLHIKAAWYLQASRLERLDCVLHHGESSVRFSPLQTLHRLSFTVPDPLGRWTHLCCPPPRSASSFRSRYMEVWLSQLYSGMSFSAN